MIALDMKTGKEIWSVKSRATKDGIAMTGAPLVANGVLITGMAGAEYGSRGYVEGYEPKDGTRLWRRYTVPRPGEPGAETWPDNAANASGGGVLGAPGKAGKTGMSRQNEMSPPLRAAPRGYLRIALGRGEGLRIHRVALSRRIPPVLVRVLRIRWPAWQAIARLSLPDLHTGM